MKTYLVGGAVRDSLLYLPVKDRDWVVIGATPKIMLEKGFQQIGKNFPVFLHPNTHEEYALARTEYKSSKGHNGFITQSSPNITLEQDLKRRDLTINAIALDENGELFDPHGGKNDLENRILRHVSTAFTEDPLRVLRVARFAAQFAHLNFSIAEETQSLLLKMTASGELEHITVERVWKETEKALLTRNPQVYFQVLYDCNALQILFPELNDFYYIPAPIECHSETNFLEYALMNLTIAATLSDEIDVRFATFFHNIGYILPLKHINNYHFSANLNVIEKLCQRLHVPRYIRDLTLIATKFYHIVHFIDQQPADVLVSLFDHIDAWRKPYRIEQIALISEVDARTRALGRTTLYPQGNYIRKAFKLTQSVSIKDIINNGFKDKEIRKELTRRRVLAIHK